MNRGRQYLAISALGVLVLLAGLTGGCAVSTDTGPGESAASPSGAESGTPSVETGGSGTLEVLVTDAPREDRQVTSVMVTVSQVQVHRAVAEEEQEQQQGVSDNQTQEQEEQMTQQGGSGWITIGLSENASTFDLMTLIGVEQFLGASDVDPGKYTQVRLVLKEVKVGFLGEDEPQVATVPSKELKLVRPFNVVEGETTTIVVDFDAARMVNVTGSGKILIKPVVKLTVRQEGSEVGNGGQGEQGDGTGQESLITLSCDDFAEEHHITPEVQVAAGELFTLTLCSNASTGFQWSESASIGDESVLEQAAHEFLPPQGEGDEEPAPGTPGRETWTFYALQAGTSSVSLEYSQPWDGGVKAEWTFTATVTVE